MQIDDPFQLLGLPARFELDLGMIERAYLSRAASAHPDIAGDDEKSALLTARLNRAKHTLLNPEKRASALLAALGGPTKEQDKSLPDGFLMEMMETRESIEQAIASNDAIERPRWEAWAAGQRRDYIAKVGALFASAERSPSPESLRTIRRELNAWRYIERLIEQLDPKYDPSVRDFQQ